MDYGRFSSMRSCDREHGLLCHLGVVMNSSAMLALKWIREASTEYQRGYVLGFINALRTNLDEWEHHYLVAIAQQRFWKGVSA